MAEEWQRTPLLEVKLGKRGNNFKLQTYRVTIQVVPNLPFPMAHVLKRNLGFDVNGRLGTT